jgi:hypothetical protein
MKIPRPRSAHDIGMTGCRGVLAATLLVALTDVREGGQHCASAAFWLNDDREDGPFSFVNVCDSLGLDPAQVRRAARNGLGRSRWARRTSTPK